MTVLRHHYGAIKIQERRTFRVGVRGEILCGTSLQIVDEQRGGARTFGGAFVSDLASIVANRRIKRSPGGRHIGRAANAGPESLSGFQVPDINLTAAGAGVGDQIGGGALEKNALGIRSDASDLRCGHGPKCRTWASGRTNTYQGGDPSEAIANEDVDDPIRIACDEIAGTALEHDETAVR